MKTFFILLILAVSAISFSYGQGKQHEQMRYSDANGFIHTDTIVNDSYCLCLIKTAHNPDILSRYVILNDNDWISQYIMKDRKEAMRLYGNECVLVENLKPNIQVVPIKQLFEQFHIDPKDWNLPVFVDKYEVTHPKTMMAVKSAVISIKIITEPGTKQRYISITTTKKGMNGIFVG
jgi:hypothetical protein